MWFTHIEHQSPEVGLEAAWTGLSTAAYGISELAAKYKERTDSLYRAQLLVRIRQSRLIVELISLYTIKIVC